MSECPNKKWFSKLKVWTKKARENPDKDQLYLRLFTDDRDGSIDLCIADKDGKMMEGGHVLSLWSINHKGIFFILPEHVDPKFPFVTDIIGCVETHPEWEMKQMTSSERHCDHAHGDSRVPVELLKALKAKIEQDLKK